MQYKRMVQLAIEISKTLSNTPFKARWEHLVENGEWDALVKHKANPADYPSEDGLAYRHDAQLASLLSKLDCLPTSVDKEDVAIKAFLSGENRCYHTNRRVLRTLYPLYDDPSSQLEERARILLYRARRWITKTLGPIPDFLDGRFGPGNVAESIEWPLVSAYSKIVYPPAHSENFSDSLRRALVWDTAWGRAQDWLWDNQLVSRRVSGGRLTTVPKDGSTDRAITIEPGENVFAQLAVGSHFKKRLTKAGLRLIPGRGHGSSLYRHFSGDGQEFHRRLAKEGSVSGRWVTLDFKNASNHNAKEPITFCFGAWSPLLEELRSPCVTLPDGRVLRLEMFSAMGNGFTFEVLTAFLMGLAYAVGYVPGVDAFAFGDDVILENDYRVREFVALAQFVGHEVNKRKSFTDGPFRESCGGDYWNGEDVRPVVIDKHPTGPLEWMELHNHLLRKGYMTTKVRRLILDQVKPEFRVFGPPSAPGCFHAPRVHWTRPKPHTFEAREEKRYNAVLSSMVVPVPKLAKLFPAAREPKVLMLLGAMGIPLDGVAIRDQVAGYKVKWFIH